MRLARCRTHKIPWLTTQIILVRAPSKQTLRQPFCAAARPIRTEVKRRAGGGVSLSRGGCSAGRAQKKRSRPGNCARRRRLQKESFARQEPAGSASVLQGASFDGPGTPSRRLSIHPERATKTDVCCFGRR